MPGYGFIARMEDLYAKAKAGKAVLTLPKGAEVLPPLSLVGELG
jgi:topoisomerase IV subunit A